MSSYKDASATDANALKTVLDPEDDAAHVRWGGDWRMPTDAEWTELLNSNNCIWTWYGSGNTEFGGTAGYKVTSKKSGFESNFIFLPAAGYQYDVGLYNAGARGYYWSTLLELFYPFSAWSVYFGSGDYYNTDYSRRCYGQSVRPVCP